MTNFYIEAGVRKPKKTPQAKSVEAVHRSAFWHMYQSSQALFLTETELRLRLLKKTDNQEWINEAIDRLKIIGDLKSDKTFAQAYIEQSYFGDYGAGRIFEVLTKKHIPKKTIVEELATYQSVHKINELEIVTNYIRGYYSSLATISREKLIQKLTKRGFKHADIISAIKDHDDSQNLKSKLQIKAEKTDLSTEIKKGERSHKGLRAIKYALKAKLVDVSRIDVVANHLANEGQIDFYARCHECLVSYEAKKSLDLENYQDRTKAFSHLNQRGYSSEEIKFAFEEIKQNIT
ncbi:recombinase A [Vibrio parahaemolyticus]|nr:recombinase A [Vibrio parahaemolyticus]